ncbi:MAG TPA: ketoacyl-ACP synthase III, partial [Pirellulaceae bacterium]|nr:ketoacyl-ACP synthase III [Pirellulaceae bacterium]
MTDSPGKARIRRSSSAAANIDPTISISAHLAGTSAESAGTSGSSVAAVSIEDDRVSLLDVVGVKPRRKVTNDELRQWLPQWTETDIVDRTGIESRYWVEPGETVLSLATDAAQRLLERHALTLNDLDLVIACTTTPDCVTPSLASRVCAAVQQPGVRSTVPGYDINAACSGFLFALRQAHDYLRTQPNGRVMIVTSEVLSPMLDRSDPSTLPVFGDAAAAALVVGRGLRDECPLHFHLPVLAGHPEDGRLLGVPLAGAGTIHMRGGEVFVEAVRSMTRILTQACTQGGLSLPDLDLVIPHQANQRILDAVAHRAGRPAFSNIRTLGNTSSCTIPLALEELMPTVHESQRWG